MRAREARFSTGFSKFEPQRHGLRILWGWLGDVAFLLAVAALIVGLYAAVDWACRRVMAPAEIHLIQQGQSFSDGRAKP